MTFRHFALAMTAVVLLWGAPHGSLAQPSNTDALTQARANLAAAQAELANARAAQGPVTQNEVAQRAARNAARDQFLQNKAAALQDIARLEQQPSNQAALQEARNRLERLQDADRANEQVYNDALGATVAAASRVEQAEARVVVAEAEIAVLENSAQAPASLTPNPTTPAQTTTATPPPTPPAPPTQSATVTPPQAPTAAPTTQVEQAVITPRPQNNPPQEPQIAAVNPERPVEPPRLPDHPPNPPQGTGLTESQVDEVMKLLDQIDSQITTAVQNRGLENPTESAALNNEIVDFLNTLQADGPSNPPTDVAPTVDQLKDRMREMKERRQQANVVQPQSPLLQHELDRASRQIHRAPTVDRHRRFSDPPPTWKRRHQVNRHPPSTQQSWRNNHRFQVRRYTQPQVNLQRTYRPAATHRTKITRCRKVGSRVHC